MNTQTPSIEAIGIVGTGAMGRGIAQIAALAGLSVHLFDTKPEAVTAARDYLAETFAKLVAKGKLEATRADDSLAQVTGASSLNDLAGCQLVVEAIVEKIEAKRALFEDLETIVDAQCILASNTSSLSITAIAASCDRPERIAGYHFFNPVPLMKVVEVIDGLRTSPIVGDALMELARRMGHTPVRAKDMPGFIVNHAGRGMNTEGLRVAGEGVASFTDIDRIMREQAGFRLGPFELLDLTALDVSHPVMESIYHQFFEEPRFTPSPISAVRFAGGMLGRKTGEGFYKYVDGKAQVETEPAAPTELPASVWVSQRYAKAHAAVCDLLNAANIEIDWDDAPKPHSLILVTPLGQDATSAAVDEDLDASHTVAIDTLFPLETGRRRVLMTTPATKKKYRDFAHALFANDGSSVTVIRDSAGFVAQRIVATIVNIGCDIAQRQIASPTDIDLAVHLGLGYPLGPLALGDCFGAMTIFSILQNMVRNLGEPRYRPSPWLARRALLKTSLIESDVIDS
ncbi:3-hydroxyacyl-CoA dehydrogenase [Caballeronia sp. LP006]|uniref:3-hydroxyacyl-CoA dehydrogenase n=1 Tax=Caballeronia sp. LP006 TaxID=3038552 RepID=UPI0028570103|nr:3-hydroxyacyl-CoA dehydrogenase [Caballeronia sp. LP006]MDR5826274.1 3-hydroxyacyl-CoA dehydrogenase [Caballeronia sp. LP006]